MKTSDILQLNISRAVIYWLAASTGGQGDRGEWMKVLVTTTQWIVSTWVYTLWPGLCSDWGTGSSNTLYIYSNISPQLGPISRYLANLLKGFCEIGIFVSQWYCEYSKRSGHRAVTGQERVNLSMLQYWWFVFVWYFRKLISKWSLRHFNQERLIFSDLGPGCDVYWHNWVQYKWEFVLGEVKCDRPVMGSTNTASWILLETPRSHTSMDLQEESLSPALTENEGKEEKVEAGANNNSLPAQVSVDELELLKKLEEANRWGWWWW